MITKRADRAIARAVSDGLVPTDGWPTRHVYLDDDAPAIARVRAVMDGLTAVPDAAVFRVVSDVVALRRVRRRERYTRRASVVGWGGRRRSKRTWATRHARSR